MFQETASDELTPWLVMVQFSFSVEGCHSTIIVPWSLVVSEAVVFNNATSSSSMCHVPFSSGSISSPPFHNCGESTVGATLRTSTSLTMVVVVPSSSVATAVMGNNPSNVGIKVHVGWVVPSSQSKPGQEIETCWPEGEEVSISSMSTASTVIGDSTSTASGWVRLKVGARLRMTTSTTNSSVSSSSSTTSNFTDHVPLFDQFHCVQQSGASMRSYASPARS